MRKSKKLTVFLDKTYKEDSLQYILDAIMMIKGIDYVATQDAEIDLDKNIILHEIKIKIFDLIKEIDRIKNFL